MGKPHHLAIEPRHADALERLAIATTLNKYSVGGPKTPQEVLDHLLDSLGQAIDRPGSWERAAFTSVFGEDLDFAAPSANAMALPACR